MKVYFDDEDLDGQFQRTLTHAYERGADLGEAFATAARITPGDDESWYREWSASAAAAQAAAKASRNAGRTHSATDAFLRACEYHRQAMFYLRGDLDDPRAKESYLELRECFRQAIGGLPYEVEAVRIPYQGTTLNGYLMTPDGPDEPRPTVLFPAGYDSVAEECHLYGASAIRRGYTVLAFEGPGQGGVLYEQGLHLRPDFEAVLTPVVDFALTRPEVDGKGWRCSDDRSAATSLPAARQPNTGSRPSFATGPGRPWREGEGTRAGTGAGSDPVERLEGRRPACPDDGQPAGATDMATANGSTWDSYLPRVPAHAPRFHPGRPRRRHHLPHPGHRGRGRLRRRAIEAVVRVACVPEGLPGVHRGRRDKRAHGRARPAGVGRLRLRLARCDVDGLRPRTRPRTSPLRGGYSG